MVSENQLKANYAPIQRNALNQALQNAINKITEVVEACMIATTVSTESDQYGAFNNDLIHKNLEELKILIDEGKVATNLEDLKNKLLDVRAAGDGQVSPFISSMFGADETIIETSFSNTLANLEMISNVAHSNRSGALARFRTKLTIIRDFSDSLLSLSNSLRG